LSFKLLSRCGFYLCITAVTALALMPVQEVAITTGWDKANHCLAFTVLLGLLDNGYPKLALWTKKLSFLILYGIMIEAVQAFTPDRFFSLWDIFADVIGLSIYLVVRPLIIQNLPFIHKEDFQI
jgi:VanZ family protein